GLARVDFLVERLTETPYVLEINTLPGFTPVSMYPRLMEASDVPYTSLIDQLIRLALDAARHRHALMTGD
ncbi:MAG: D-alanine--D-alanine ligase A, partial [Pseudomonadota bacterium]|nr:D-alanine--D-alanine ligase A [Pseudomonadota bacterium]